MKCDGCNREGMYANDTRGRYCIYCGYDPDEPGNNTYHPEPEELKHNDTVDPSDFPAFGKGIRMMTGVDQVEVHTTEGAEPMAKKTTGRKSVKKAAGRKSAKKTPAKKTPTKKRAEGLARGELAEKVDSVLDKEFSLQQQGKFNQMRDDEELNAAIQKTIPGHEFQEASSYRAYYNRITVKDGKKVRGFGGHAKARKLTDPKLFSKKRLVGWKEKGENVKAKIKEFSSR